MRFSFNIHSIQVNYQTMNVLVLTREHLIISQTLINWNWFDPKMAITLTIRSSDGIVFLMQISETQTVKDLKKKIEALRGNEFRIEWQSLFFCGQEMVDSCLITDHKFLQVPNSSTNWPTINLKIIKPNDTEGSSQQQPILKTVITPVTTATMSSKVSRTDGSSMGQSITFNTRDSSERHVKQRKRKASIEESYTENTISIKMSIPQDMSQERGTKVLNLNLNLDFNDN